MYGAFKTENMKLLNDALYQRACEEHLYLVVDGGTDHARCCAFGGLLYSVMAANLWERVELIMPKALGATRNANRSVVVTANLLLALWYGEPALKEQSRREAMAKLGTKMTQYERSTILYLLSLLDGKPLEASMHLKSLCEGVKRLDKNTASKFQKAFCIEAHGLFNLAVRLGIQGVEMPVASNFSRELAKWQIAGGSSHGSLFFVYAEPLELVNAVLAVTPPAIKLYQPCADDAAGNIHSGAFRDEIRDAVLRHIGLDPDMWFIHQMPHWLVCSDEEKAFINKYHCNRLSCIRLHRDDFGGGVLPRRMLRFGTSELMAAEVPDIDSGKHLWAVVVRKKKYQNKVSYYSLYYSAYYESLEALLRGSTVIYRGMKRLATSMTGREYAEKGISYCFEVGRMNVAKSVSEASAEYLSHRMFFGDRRPADGFSESIRIAEIPEVTQELELLCRGWHMDIGEIRAVLEAANGEARLYSICDDEEIKFAGSISEILRVLDNGVERVMLDFYLTDSKRAHLKSAQTVADEMI